MHDWDGFRETMTEEWILYPPQKGKTPDPQQRLVWLHLQALSQLARLALPELAISAALTAERLFDALRSVVPIAASVVYDLRELLDFLTRMDEEDGEHPFHSASLEAYRQRVGAALELSNETFTWRLSTNRNAFVPRFEIGGPPIVPMLLAS